MDRSIQPEKKNFLHTGRRTLFPTQNNALIHDNTKKNIIYILTMFNFFRDIQNLHQDRNQTKIS